MKQILQNLSDGETLLADVPSPGCPEGGLLIETTFSVVSPGTERMLLDFGKASWIDRARQQPDKVRQVLDKVRTDGLLPTVEAVRAKLDQSIPLGYSQCGVVVESRAEGFEKGDRVVSNGAHAEIAAVPVNLCAKIPDDVTDEDAAFTVIASIALQGVRLAQPTLGESFVVSGLGLVGMFAVQILRANGCRVLGIDFHSQRCRLAETLGAEVVDLSAGEDPLLVAREFAGEPGIDGAIIAAATQSSDPVHQAAQMCRKRGRIVLVGVTGLELQRADFYEKELSFQVSCSYGPGRYDEEYEQGGLDYPIGFVRWTEQRNFSAVLQLMAEGRLSTAPLVTGEYEIEDALRVYSELHADSSAHLGVRLRYAPGHLEGKRRRTVVTRGTKESSRLAETGGRCRIGVIGAGNFASRILMPAFGRAGAELVTVVSEGGVSAAQAARKFGFVRAATDSDEVFKDGEIDAVVIATRHDTHADLTLRALDAGKHVFVEKPLCLARSELAEIEAAQAESNGDVMVGFNRRFSPHTRALHAATVSRRGPAAMVMTVNAGSIPPDHWTRHRQVGGGRLIGEACHFVDLLRSICGAPIVEHSVSRVGMDSAGDPDCATLHLGFADGSTGTIHYLTNGDRSYPKERLEVFVDGKVFALENFRKTRGYGAERFRTLRTLRQDKGHRDCVAAFVNSVVAGDKELPIPFEEIAEVSRVVLSLGGAEQGGTQLPQRGSEVVGNGNSIGLPA